MGRALKVGDYVYFNEKGLRVMGYEHSDTLFRIDHIGCGTIKTNRKSYHCQEVLSNGEEKSFGEMLRNEIRLAKEPELPTPRVTFKSWMKEKAYA